MKNIVQLHERPKPFFYLPMFDIYCLVFEANAELFGACGGPLPEGVSDKVELFVDDAYSGMLLADVDLPSCRGLFYVTAGRYTLHRLAEDPLTHFK